MFTCFIILYCFHSNFIKCSQHLNPFAFPCLAPFIICTYCHERKRDAGFFHFTVFKTISSGKTIFNLIILKRHFFLTSDDVWRETLTYFVSERKITWLDLKWYMVLLAMRKFETKTLKSCGAQLTNMTQSAWCNECRLPPSIFPLGPIIMRLQVFPSYRTTVFLWT